MGYPERFVPIYTTGGKVEAFLVYPYIYSISGDWIGWITRNRHVYSVHGHYVGWLSEDQRILRKHTTAHIKPRLNPPPPPVKVDPPATKQMQAAALPELKVGTFDVLDEAPELLPSVESDKSKEDQA